MKRFIVFMGISLLAANSFALIDFVQHDITLDYPLALDAYPEDIDGDGDMDFVSTSSEDDLVSWWENDGNQNFAEHFVSEHLVRGRTVMAVDIDEDGDLDFLGAGWDPGIVIWWENDGSLNFTEHVIEDDFPGAHTVAVGDMDDDGDMDVLCSAYRASSGEIAWWENDGEELFLVKHTVNDMTDRNACVCAVDVNDDGFMDVVGCGYLQGDVSWWENDGNQIFAEHVIGTNFAGAHWIHADDIDGDGDPDIVGAAYAAGKVSWWENLGNEQFSEHLIDDTWMGTAWVHIEDMDNDDDMDVVAVAEVPNAVLWWENDGSENFTVDPVITAYSGAFSAYPSDMDDDGDMDILATASSSNRISWFESLGGEGEPMIITGPGPAYDNPPLVRVFPAEPGAVHVVEFHAYGSPHYGLNVACGNLAGDPAMEILSGAGGGEIYGPHVRGFHADGTPLTGLSFFAYGTNHFGVNVAAADLDGNGSDEILTGAGPGAVFGPHVRAFSYNGTAVIPIAGVNYFAYGTPKWGVNVAGGDIDGDGFDEIITGAGPGAIYGPHVRGWNVDGGGAAAIPGVSFMAYGTNKFGVNVTAGDVDGDGIDEIVTGAGPGVVFGPHVRGWNYDGSSLVPLAGMSFFAWQNSSLRYGVNVFAGADLSGDGRDELVAGCGPDPAADSEVKVFTYDGTAVELWFSLEGYDPAISQGCTIAAGWF